MVVPFGFSVGDFISGIDALVTAIKAVRDVGGSSTQYQALASELEILKAGLSSILFFDLEPQTSDVFVNLCEAAASCEECIKSFIKKIAKYQPWLKPDTEGWKAGLRKIRWAFCNKKDVVEFRQQITQRICTIQLHISAVHAKHCLEGHKMQVHCQSTADATLQAVVDITSRTSRSEALLKSLSSQQLDQCEETQQLLKETNDSMKEILKRQIELLQRVRQQNEIPPQVPLQRPVKLLDACGYETYFHLDFIVSLDVFKHAIRSRFEERGVSPKGLQKVDRLEFAVRAGKKELSLKRKWQQVFKPGEIVEMSMNLRHLHLENICPGCQSENESTDNSEIECIHCGLQIHRVTEIAPPNPPNTELIGGSSANSLTEPNSSAAVESSSSLEELSQFRRVDVVFSRPPSPPSTEPVGGSSANSLTELNASVVVELSSSLEEQYRIASNKEIVWFCYWCEGGPYSVYIDSPCVNCFKPADKNTVYQTVMQAGG